MLPLIGWRKISEAYMRIYALIQSLNAIIFTCLQALLRAECWTFNKDTSSIMFLDPSRVHPSNDNLTYLILSHFVAFSSNCSYFPAPYSSCYTKSSCGLAEWVSCKPKQPSSIGSHKPHQLCNVPPVPGM